MTTLMQRTLGPDWDRLPPALKAHHQPADGGTTLDRGQLDIHFPGFVWPVVKALKLLGALVSRRSPQVATDVVKIGVGERQLWRRTLTFADGSVQRFNSAWEPGPPGCVTEFVNPWMGLTMRPWVEGERLHIDGEHFVFRLGRWQLRVPEGLLLGHTTIVEEALDAHRFRMDFRLTHPLFGQVYRYAGTFEAALSEALTQPLTPSIKPPPPPAPPAPPAAERPVGRAS